MVKWEYGEAGPAITGNMICSACGQKISSGEYRYRMKYSPDGDKDKDRYINIHRSCSTSDIEWSLRDERHRQHTEYNESLLRAAIEFRDKWAVWDLDELIKMLEEE